MKTGDLRGFFEGLPSRLSGTTRNGIERDCKALFRQAHHDGASPKDIGRGVVKTPVDGKEPLALSEEEAEEFLRHLEGTSVHLPALVMYCTGIRPEEMRGLCWDALDTEEGILRVSRRCVSVGRKEINTDKLKTNRSKRALRIDEALSTLLDAKRLEIGLQMAERGPHWADLNLVFSTLRCSSETYVAGRIWTATAFGHAWVKARGPYKHVTPYTMRHTFITQRLMQGVRLEVVSRLAGHASSAITAKHYSHVLEEELSSVVVTTPRMQGGRQP